MEQHARRVVIEEPTDFDEDTAIPLDAEEILSLLESDVATQEAEDAVSGIANGILIGAALWLVSLGALYFFL
jgi:hypothetical protein